MSKNTGFGYTIVNGKAVPVVTRQTTNAKDAKGAPNHKQAPATTKSDRTTK